MRSGNLQLWWEGSESEIIRSDHHRWYGAKDNFWEIKGRGEGVGNREVVKVISVGVFVTKKKKEVRSGHWIVNRSTLNHNVSIKGKKKALNF